jgi:hypothetical protein
MEVPISKRYLNYGDDHIPGAGIFPGNKTSSGIFRGILRSLGNGENCIQSLSVIMKWSRDHMLTCSYMRPGL